MRAWLRLHWRAAALALRKLAAQRLAGLAGLFAIAIALALPAGGFALLESIAPYAARGSLDPHITLYLRADLSRPDSETLGRRLRGDSRITDVRFVAREAAAKELSSIEGYAEIFEALGRNPLPDAFLLSVRGGGPAAVQAIARELGRMSGVDRVHQEAEWARRLAALAAAARTSIVILAVLLGVGLIAVTFNSIRLQILTQRDEIEVSCLIGATDAFVRRPFYYYGVLQGAGGASIALAIVYAAVAIVNRDLRAFAATYGSDFELGTLSPAAGLFLLVAGGLLGWIGAGLSVQRHLGQVEGH